MLLSHIKPNERVTQSELASRLVVTESNVTQIIKKLEDNGLIQRQREWKNKYHFTYSKKEQNCEAK